MRFWCTANRPKCKTKASRQKQKKLLLLLNSVIDFTENSRSTAISLALSLCAALTSFLSTIYFFYTKKQAFREEKIQLYCILIEFYVQHILVNKYVRMCACVVKCNVVSSVLGILMKMLQILSFFVAPRSFHSLFCYRSSLISSIFSISFSNIFYAIGMQHKSSLKFNIEFKLIRGANFRIKSNKIKSVAAARQTPKIEVMINRSACAAQLVCGAAFVLHHIVFILM